MTDSVVGRCAVIKIADSRTQTPEGSKANRKHLYEIIRMNEKRGVVIKRLAIRQSRQMHQL